jgi:hypothetical protein
MISFGKGFVIARNIQARNILDLTSPEGSIALTTLRGVLRVGR